ncbi:YitT family protein [Alkaliphilus hydrothermalis]|uniref:Uncharacterized membrane-anchored protein YitT (DUF2179 family) n=1 Tax=Alkaliphilus hydrothermalis TaxID=1482730 RepID=A0ABS2NMT1_9FIRM|nr:uncharacterized membrane-anchored protein YitT (DUF2179 family) [Alkaliphilus hydrothermalis]
MNNEKYKKVLDYVVITIGAAIMALSLNFFLEPNTIAPGGVTGLAIVVYKLTGIPIDVTNLALNIPLFIAGIIVLGGVFGLKTAYATVMLSVFIRLFIVIFGHGFIVTQDILLASIYGGLLMGIGLGMIFLVGGTTGGTDLAGAILNKYFPSLSTAKLMMILDLIIVVTAGFVERNVETTLYSIIALYILVKIADFIVEGLSFGKAFYIISSSPSEIGKKIMDEMERGVTVLEGRGMYTGSQRDVLLCVVNRAQVTKLKRIVYGVDPRAFIMITTVHEVLGEGFKEIK